MESKLKILIADDHKVTINGILFSLSEIGDFDVQTTTSCEEAFTLIKRHCKTDPFDILFTDLSFDNTTSNSAIDSGESLIRAIRSEEIPIKIAVVTGHGEINRVYNTVKNLEPSAYILKGKCDSDELNFAIQKIMKGERFYTHEVHEKLMKRNIAEILMDDIAVQILSELPKHSKIHNMEGTVKRTDGSTLSIRSIEKKLSILRVDLDAHSNLDLVLKAKELGIID